MTLLKLSNDDLISKTKSLVGTERRILADVLCHLREIERRRLYLEKGYGDFVVFCVEYLGYQRDQAYRRIAASRLLRDLPELESKIEEGALSLTVLNQAQSFFRQEEIQSKKPLSIDQKKEVMAQLENKSTREVEKKLLSLSPNYSPKPTESIKPISETHSELKLVLDNVTLEEFRKIKDLLAQKGIRQGKTMNLVEALKVLVKEGLEKHDPLVKAEKKARTTFAAPQKSARATDVASPLPKSPKSPKSRYIAASIRHYVWLRDKGQCHFIDPVTKKLCGSKYRLQLDHIIPFDQGGLHTKENLRLRCANHNTWHAIQIYGEKKMGAYLKSQR